MQTKKTNEKYTLVYGTDTIEGLFIQVRPVDNELQQIFFLSKRGHPSLSIERIVKVAEDYGFDISNELDDGSGLYGSGCGGGCDHCARQGV